jgi:hypothetical protein
MMRQIEVHYLHHPQLIEFKCPYCRLLQWSRNWKLIDGKPAPEPRTVVLQHLKECPEAMVGETYQFQTVMHASEASLTFPD